MRKWIRLLLRATYLVLLLLFVIMILYVYALKDDVKTEISYSSTLKGALYIVGAIERYCSETGDTPQSLEVLVPKYLPKVYPATWGDSGWVYEKHGKGFNLAVGYKVSDSNDFLYPRMSYYSENKAWDFNN